MNYFFRNKYVIFITIFTWITLLNNTDSYRSVYILVGIVSVLSLFVRDNDDMNKRSKLIAALFSLIITTFVTFANYSIGNTIFGDPDFMLGRTAPYEYLLLLIIEVTGFVVFYNIFRKAQPIMSICYSKLYISKKRFNNKKLVFLFTFFITLGTALIVLFSSQFPGELTTDSINQITQILNNDYSNHHPFWHTQVIRVFYNLGFYIFGKANKAVGTYVIFQIVVYSLIAAYSNMTLNELGVHRLINILNVIFLAFIPYNLLYSMTVWKDVMFGYSVFLFTIEMARLFVLNSQKSTDYFILFFSSIGFGVFRNNGLIALIISSIVIFFLMRKKNSEVVIAVVSAMILSVFMQTIALDWLNVKQTDIVESISIPCQQVARVIYDDKEIGTQEYEMISKVASIDKIRERYDPNISDPIKNIIRKSDGYDYFQKNLKEYLSIYIKLGIRYPVEYVKGWIDQTKGFFNGGYETDVEAQGIKLNELKIYRKKQYFNQYNTFLINYRVLFRKLDCLTPFISVGLHFWLYLFLLNYACQEKRKSIIAITVPFIAIIATLLVATPVYAEFRYAYPIMLSCYFVFLSSVKKINDNDI